MRNNEYVYLDGMMLNEEHLMKLAQNVGCYAQAEHYLFALLAHGVICGKREVIDMVNEVREFYGVPKIPVGNQTFDSSESKADALNDKARMIFKKMARNEQRKVLRDSLSQLRTNHHLFIYARHWLGVFLVIRDRLEGESLKMKDFIDYACDIMPSDWPETLRMRLSTYKNFGREIDYCDKGEAYYDMDNCPQKELCCFSLSNDSAARMRVSRLTRDHLVEKTSEFVENGTTKAIFKKTGRMMG